MKRPLCLTIATGCLSLLVACSPSIYTMPVQMRQPSDSGVDVCGRSVAIAYVAGERGDSLINAGISEGLALALESEYFDGKQAIPVYSIQETGKALYYARDTLRSLVMDTGQDLVFLLDKSDFGSADYGLPQPTGLASPDSLYKIGVSLPVTLHLYVYDSFDPRDTVMIYSATTSPKLFFYGSAEESGDELLSKTKAAFSASSRNIGAKLGSSFESEWKVENFSFYFYDRPEWIDALSFAYAFNWQKAIDIWTGLAGSGPLKQAAAAYDIATACYMLQEYELALSWLDVCDSSARLSHSATLRKRVVSKMKNQ